MRDSEGFSNDTLSLEVLGGVTWPQYMPFVLSYQREDFGHSIPGPAEVSIESASLHRRTDLVVPAF